MSDKNNNRRIKKDLERTVRKLVPEIGQLAVVRFQGNFNRQEFAGKAWKPRKPKGHYRKDGTFVRSRKRRSDNRGILIGKGSGALQRSIRVTSSSGLQVRIAANHYGKFHNLGLKPLPKRQFMGVQGDVKLQRQINILIKRRIEKALK